MVRTPALYSDEIRFAESAPRDTSNSASMPNFWFNKGSSHFLNSALDGIANTILPSALAFCSVVSHSPRHSAADAGCDMTKIATTVGNRETIVFVMLFSRIYESVSQRQWRC